MLDLRLLRDDPARVRTSQRLRGERVEVVDELLAADETHRSRIAEFETLRAEQKQLGRSVGPLQGRLKKTGDDATQRAAVQGELDALLAKTKGLSDAVKEAEQSAQLAATELERLQYAVSNVVLAGVPGGGEDDYVVLEEIGAKPTLADPKDHLELGESLGAIDMARGAKVSGARFYFLTGVGAQLELGLLSMAVAEGLAAGFTPVITPTLVKPEIMAGTGFLGAHADEIYHLPADGLYLVGTSEVALAGYHSGEILDLSDGPLRYAGWSACYRREAGSYGKDTRGIIRVHQFHKVEMFVYCTEDDAAAEHQRLLDLEKAMLAKVELPYRVIDTAAGDLGSSAARKYDCEAWLPSQQRYLEVSSTSNCTTFQARRLNIRERTDSGTRTVATLNGTLGTTRWIVPLLENHQQPDGSVYVPVALRPYLGGREVLEPLASARGAVRTQSR